MKMPPEHWAKNAQESLGTGLGAIGNMRSQETEIDLSPINEAMSALSHTAQSVLGLQEALEKRLQAYYLPYPVRGADTSNMSETQKQSCQHESMLRDVRHLLYVVAERQEALLKALQV